MIRTKVVKTCISYFTETKNDKIAGEIIGTWVNDNTFFSIKCFVEKIRTDSQHLFRAHRH